jgi:hypothetical protein
MNRLLIGVLDILNKLVALLLIVSGAVSGWYGQYAPPDNHVLGAVIGLIGGIVVAGLVSGFVATIITISRELTLIRAIAETRPAFDRNVA